MSELAKLLVRYGVDVSDIDKAEGQIKNSMNRVGNHALSIGKTIASAAGLGSLIYVGANVAKSFLSFEDAMTKVKVVSGATGEEFTKLNELAREMGTTTEFSADQVANAMYELSSAGLAAADQASVLPAVLDLATAGSLDLSTAAETVMKTISGFGMAGTEAGHVTDVLALAVNKSMLHFEDLALSMKYVAPIAGATSQSLEDMTAALAIMSDAGIRGEQAGTSLRAGMLRLVDPTAEVLEGFKQLGITQADLDPSTHKLSEIVSILADKTSGLTDSQKNQALANIFGTEALSGLLAIINKGPAALNDLSSSLLNSGNAAKTSAEQMRESTGKQLEILKNKLMDVGYTVIEEAMPSIEKLIAKIQELADSGKLEEWGEMFGDILSNAVDLAGDLITVVDWVIDKFGGLQNVLYGVAAAYATMKLASWAGGLSSAGAAAGQVAGSMSGTGAGAGVGVLGSVKNDVVQAGKNYLYAEGGIGSGLKAAGATAMSTATSIAAIGTAAVAAGIAIKGMADSLKAAKDAAIAAEANANNVIGANQAQSIEEATLAYQSLKGTLDESSDTYNVIKQRLLDLGVAETTAGQAAALAASGRKEANYAINAEIQRLKGSLNSMEEGSEVYQRTERNIKDLSNLMNELDKKTVYTAAQIQASVKDAVANMGALPAMVTNALASSDETFYAAGVEGMGQYTEGILANIGAPPEVAAEMAQTVRDALASEDPAVRENAANTIKAMLNEMASKEQISYTTAQQISDAISKGLTITTNPSIGVGTVIDQIIATLRNRKASLDEIITAVNASLNSLGGGGGGTPPSTQPYTTWGDGGFVTGPTFGLAGEDGIEVVLPLTNPARTLSLMAQSLQIMGLGGSGRSSGTSVPAGAISGGGGGGGTSWVVNVNVGTLMGDDRSLEKFARKMKYEIEPVVERAMGGR